MTRATYFDTEGIVFSNDDQVFDLPPMSPSANLDEIRQYVAWLDQWRRIREQLAAGGVLAKMVTFRDLLKYGLLDLTDQWETPEAGTSSAGTYHLPCSDLTSDLEANAFAGYFRATSAFTLGEVRASLLTASTAGVVTIAITVNGVALLSTNLTIDQGEKTSVTAAVRAVLAFTAIANDAEVIVEIVGPGAAARGLEVALIEA